MRIGLSALALRGRPRDLDSGIARYCFSLIEALMDLESKYEFVVWVSPGFELPDEWQGKPGFEFRTVGGPLARFKTLWEVCSAGRAARRSRCDVWFSTAHALPWRCRVPTLLSVQDLFTFSHPEFYTPKHRWVIGWALRRAVGQADHLIAISEHTRDELGRLFAIAPDRVTVTPLGLGNTVSPLASGRGSTAALAELGLGGERFLLTLSTIEPRKNLPRLFAAFSAVAQRPENADLRLAVVGRLGWKTAPSLERPRELGIADRVDFLGYVPDDELPKLFAACQGFVLPSIIEGFGLPLLEALAYGAPVACSRSGSLPEVGGEVPVYFDPLDIDDMTVALLRLLAPEQSREELAERGRRRAALFDWQQTATRTLQALEAAHEGAA